MGFLQKLEKKNKKTVFCELRNINFITFNKEKNGSVLHTVFGMMIDIENEPQSNANLFRGSFVKTVFTRMKSEEDCSVFFKYHAWVNLSNVIFMKESDVFKDYTDLKFIDSTMVICCTSPISIISELSAMKKLAKQQRNNNNG